MTDLVAQLVGALQDCLDDSHQVLAQMEQMYGTNYRQNRLEAQRKTIADAEAALSAAKDGGWVLPEGKRVIVVDASFDELLYWVDRAVNKGNANSDIREAYEAWTGWDAWPLPNPPKGEV